MTIKVNFQKGRKRKEKEKIEDASLLAE